MSEFIRFEINNKLSNPDFRKLVCQCFHMTDDELPRLRTTINGKFAYHLTIICRIEQFGRFIIWRCNRGFENGMKELNAQFVQEQERPLIVNVSQRKNAVGY